MKNDLLTIASLLCGMCAFAYLDVALAMNSQEQPRRFVAERNGVLHEYGKVAGGVRCPKRILAMKLKKRNELKSLPRVFIGPDHQFFHEIMECPEPGSGEIMDIKPFYEWLLKNPDQLLTLFVIEGHKICHTMTLKMIDRLSSKERERIVAEAIRSVNHLIACAKAVLPGGEYGKFSESCGRIDNNFTDGGVGTGTGVVIKRCGYSFVLSAGHNVTELLKSIGGKVKIGTEVKTKKGTPSGIVYFSEFQDGASLTEKLFFTPNIGFSKNLGDGFYVWGTGAPISSSIPVKGAYFFKKNETEFSDVAALILDGEIPDGIEVELDETCNKLMGKYVIITFGAGAVSPYNIPVATLNDVREEIFFLSALSGRNVMKARAIEITREDGTYEDAKQLGGPGASGAPMVKADKSEEYKAAGLLTFPTHSIGEIIHLVDAAIAYHLSKKTRPHKALYIGEYDDAYLNSISCASPHAVSPGIAEFVGSLLEEERPPKEIEAEIFEKIENVICSSNHYPGFSRRVKLEMQLEQFFRSHPKVSSDGGGCSSSSIGKSKKN
ncbi:hypothetical protein FACS1894122_08570 [Alphaproteobacteria bacterium]|nr:hypothetical protein FACS1894122_08570 [Alphaproteobacteria bacterium]